MIYTVTFNPAVDYVISADNIRAGCVNRLASEEIFFGGKGINVSLILHELGVRSVALGFVSGFTGNAIEQGLKDSGIETDFVHLKKGFSRINVKIRTEKETELNGSGPEIDQAAVSELFDKLQKLKNDDILVLAGSIPKSMPSDIYEKILAFLSGKGVKYVLDASGDLLLKALKYKPFLIKPNDIELGEMFGEILDTREKIIGCAEKLKEMGAENVLVSMAEKGALLLDERGEVHQCGVCSGTAKNSVGAGDSMVAGFIAGFFGDDKCDYEYALRLGTAAGGATAFSEGLAKKDTIYSLLEQLF